MLNMHKQTRTQCEPITRASYTEPTCKITKDELNHPYKEGSKAHLSYTNGEQTINQNIAANKSQIARDRKSTATNQQATSIGSLST